MGELFILYQLQAYLDGKGPSLHRQDVLDPGIGFGCGYFSSTPQIPLPPAIGPAECAERLNNKYNHK